MRRPPQSIAHLAAPEGTDPDDTIIFTVPVEHGYLAREPSVIHGTSRWLKCSMTSEGATFSPKRGVVL